MKGLVLSDIELEAETWRIFIRSSRKYYPVKKMIYKIRMAVFSIDPDKMLRNCNTRFLPILGKEDPLALKLTRDHHVEN